MTTLNLTEQEVDRDDVQPKIVKLRNRMLLRKPVWDKISIEKRKLWVTSDKDPIMTLAWDIYRWLDNNFFGEGYDKD